MARIAKREREMELEGVGMQWQFPHEDKMSRQ